MLVVYKKRYFIVIAKTSLTFLNYLATGSHYWKNILWHIFLAIKAFLSAKCMAQFTEKIGKFEGTVVDAVSMGDHATSVNTTVACDKDGKVMDNGK